MRNYEFRLERLRKIMMPKNNYTVFSDDEVNSAIKEYNLATGKSLTIETLRKRVQNIPELSDDDLAELSKLFKYILRYYDEKL